MINLDLILSKEVSNQSSIYLYQKSDKWYAYEYSAYYFSQLFDVESVKQTEDYVCISLDQSLSFLNNNMMDNVSITSVSDYQIELTCDTTISGFEEWKQHVMTNKTRMLNFSFR